MSTTDGYCSCDGDARVAASCGIRSHRERPAPTPVVTMDARDHVYLDGRKIGYVSGNDLVTAMGRKSAAELRALADFLDQLAGANLLSGVAER